MKVAKMAESFGKNCTPHISCSGLSYLHMIHFVAAIPNPVPFHGFKGFNSEIPLKCKTSDLDSDGGIVTVPTGSGLGIEIDPDFIAKYELVKG